MELGIAATSELTGGLRIKINGAFYYMICIAAADV